MNSKFTTILAAACVFSAPLIGEIERNFPETSLAVPQFTQEKIMGVSVAVHDYRENGVRIAPDYVREKLIIHNYGHGGASLSLAWGSAFEAFDFLQLEKLSNEYQYDFGEVAVLGSGVIGLATANLLLDKGYIVTVYADKFPPNITYDPLEGLWWPAAVSGGNSRQERASFKRILKYSYEHFKELAFSDNPEYYGVTPKTIYAFDLDNKHVDNAVDHFFSQGIYASITFDNNTRKKCICHDSFHIDAHSYVSSLYEKAKAKGAYFVARSFKDEAELSGLRENVIFNCLGKGTKKVFHDEKLTIIRHQTVSLFPQEGIDYQLHSYLPNGVDSLKVFALPNRVVLGGVYQYGDSNPKADLVEAANLVNSVQEFYSRQK